jgi:hypothetical protein
MGLKERGLEGVELVVLDHHAGLRQAAGELRKCRLRANCDAPQDGGATAQGLRANRTTSVRQCAGRANAHSSRQAAHNLGNLECSTREWRSHMKKLALVAVAAVSLSTGVLLGALIHGPLASAQSPAYKVVEGTIQSPGQFEKFLNEHAAAGWRYQTDIDKQMFVFQRQ